MGKDPFPHPGKLPRAHFEQETQPRGRLLVVPRPAPTSPADAYLARLAPSSGRTLRKLLRQIAGMVAPCPDVALVSWHRLRYPDTLEIHRQLTAIYAPATCQLALAALRGVLREAWRLGQLSHEDYQRAIDLPAVRGTCHRLQPAISQVQIERLLSADSGSPRAARDLAILAILYGAGLRRAELAQLMLDDVEENTLVVLGKGRQHQLVWLSKQTYLYISRWVEVRGQKPGPLFVRIHRSGRLTSLPLSTEAIARIVHSRAAEAGIHHLTPHDLRRAMATHLLDGGTDLLVVQKLLRHASVRTTAIYDRRTEEAERAAQERLFARV